MDHASIDHTGITGVGSTIPTLVAGKVNLTTGNLSTTSSTFVDATGLTLTLTTGARRCLVGFAGTVFNSQTGALMALDLAVDGTRQGQTGGIVRVRFGGVASQYFDGSFTYLTDVLTAASHTFKIQYLTSAGTGIIAASTGDAAAIFWVQEVL